MHIFESYKVKPTTFTTLGRMHNFIGKEFSYVFLNTSIFSCSILNSLYVWNLVSLFFLSYTGGLNKIKKSCPLAHQAHSAVWTRGPGEHAV